MDARTRFFDYDEVLRELKDAIKRDINTSMVCRVAKDSDGHTAVLQPLVKAIVQKADGTSEYVSLPSIPDVPIKFPSGGGHILTHPLKEGDEVEANFHSMAFSGWFQNGGEQSPSSAAKQGLSFATCTPGLRSDPNKLQNYSPESAQFRTVDAKSCVDVSPQSVTTNRKDTISKLLDHGMTHDSEKILINCK